MRIRRTKRTLGAFLLVALCVTGVSAAIYSNMLQGNFHLTSAYPMKLSWQGGVMPWNDNCFSDIFYSGTIDIENLGDNPLTGWYVTISIVGPAGLVDANLIVYLNGVRLTFTGTGTLEATYTPTGELGAGSTVNHLFQFKFQASAPVGDYAVSIYAGIP